MSLTNTHFQTKNQKLDFDPFHFPSSHQNHQPNLNRTDQIEIEFNYR